jgi:hypothetical protein
LREVLAGSQSTRHGPLPKLQLPGDDTLISPFTREAAAIITESLTRPELAPHLYRRDTLPIIPVPGTRRFIPMKPEYFVSWADRHFAPMKIRYDKNGEPYEVIRPMPKEIANACLNSLDFTLAMPPITRTFPIPSPVIIDGGPLHLALPGYHPETGAFVFESDFPPDPELCVPGDRMVSSGGYYDERLTLRDASTYLHDLLRDMPFSDWSDPVRPTEENPFHDPQHPAATTRFSRSLAVQIMAMLSVFAAGCVPAQANRLGFLVNANKQRSGKTLLVKICVTPIYGSCKTQSWRETDDDMIKILDSETLAATSYICFDNIRSLIASAPLEGFMTAATWTGRILGRSEMFEAENNATIFLTANNASLGADMQERTLVADLYVETADRQDRGTELDPAREIDDVWLARPENRRRILSALWAIVRHWDAAGRPMATGTPRKGFATWCNILGGMVGFAGFGDCLERPLDLENCGDSETDDIRALVECVSQDGTTRHLTYHEVIHILWERGLLPWCMHGREEFAEDLGKVTLKLNDASNARLGTLLQRNCSGERGEIHVFKSATDPRTTRRVRFSCRGKGRHRRYLFEEISTKS